MTSVGETLRRERLKRHLELEQVSKELKISSRMLEAIEDEKFERLPGGVFAKSFVRQYARLLGLDESEMASQVEHLIESPFSVQVLAESQPDMAPPIHVPKVDPWESYGEDKGLVWASWMPAAVMVIVAMLVCSGIYGWWQRGRRVSAQENPAREVAAATPSTIAAAPTEPPPVAAAIETPTKSAEEAPPATAATQLPSAPAEPVKSIPVIASNPNASVRVAIIAEEPVWISARADGKYLFSGTLAANETRTIEANDILLLRLGNAGGINLTLNGKPVGTLGAKGQARTIQFTPGGFQIVVAPPAPPKPSLPL